MEKFGSLILYVFFNAEMEYSEKCWFFCLNIMIV